VYDEAMSADTARPHEEGKQHPIIHEGAEPDPVDSNEDADDKTEVLEPDGKESPHA
jgi:hypothetical protein